MKIEVTIKELVKSRLNRVVVLLMIRIAALWHQTLAMEAKNYKIN